MRFQRLLFRCLYYPVMFCLRGVELINQPIYNRMIVKILECGGVKINGRPRYISSDVYLDAFQLIELGDECVISKHVTFLTHDFSITTGLVAVGRRPEQEQKLDGRISIGRNVFIGLGATLLPNTIVGDNVIIGAKAVVKGRIPSNSVVIGNPCRVVMTIEQYVEKKRVSIN